MSKPLKILVVILLLIASVVGTYFGTKSVATNVKITVDEGVEKQAVYLVGKTKAEDDIDVVKLKSLALGDELKVANSETNVLITSKDKIPSAFTGIAIDGVKKLDNGNYIVTGDVSIYQVKEGKIDFISSKPSEV